MLENQKVYVKVVYIAGEISEINTICSSVMMKFLIDSDYYTKSDNMDCETICDKLVAKMKNTRVVYELFICNYNEIANYLH